MPESDASHPVPPETGTVILRVLQNSREPLTIERIRKALPRPYRIGREAILSIIQQQVQTGASFEWPAKGSKERYWAQGFEAYVRSGVVEVLKSGPLSLPQLRRKLGKTPFGSPKVLVEQTCKMLLHGLLEERILFKYPIAPGMRAVRYGVTPPDPKPYMGKLKKEFEALCSRLKDAGVTPDDVLHAATELLLPGRRDTTVLGQATSSPPDVPPIQEAENHILQKILEIEPAATQQVLVSIRKLRNAMALSKQGFDQAILGLAKQGKIFLHRHVYPSEMTEAEREQTVADGQGNYYVGIVLRNGP